MERKEIFLDKEVIFLEIVFVDTTYIKALNTWARNWSSWDVINQIYYIFYTKPKNTYFVVTEFVKLSDEFYTELYLQLKKVEKIS